MRGSNLSEGLRRSSRVETKVPVLVTSLEPSLHFSEMCETLVVSPHGCAVRSPMRLDPGVPLRFQIHQGRQAKAHVVDCQPMGSDQGWRVGARLDRPENCWGLESCPADWVELPQTSMSGGEQPATALPALSKPVPVKMQLLRAFVTELLEPLRAEVAGLKKKLEHGDGNGDATRSRFEVSLSHIPPEVEEKLWVRLQQDLGTQVQQQTREQAGQILGAAQDTIRQKLIETQEEFRQRAGQQLQSLEQRTRELSEEIGSYMQQRVRAEIDEIRQQAEDAGTRLEQQGGELLQSLQQRLAQEHAAQCGSMQRVQAEAAEESSRLQAQLSELSSRAAKLDESSRQLENDLQTRLQQVTNDAVSSASSQLGSAVEAVLSAQLERAKTQINGDLTPLADQARSLLGEGRSTLDSLRAENDQATLQIAAIDEEKHQFQQWMNAQTSAYKAELGDHLQQTIREAVSGAAVQLEQQLKTSLDAHLERAKNDLNRALDPLLERAKSLESTLVQETGAWLAQQGVDFRKAMHGNLTEAQGHFTAQVEHAIKEVTSRAAGELGNQLEDSCRRLQSERNRIETTVSQSLAEQVSQERENFTHCIEDVAHQSVERWRLALARNLDSIAKTMAEPFPGDAAPDQQQDH